MIFTSPYKIDIPSLDILTFLFSHSKFKENDPIWIDAENESVFITGSQARKLTGTIGTGLRDLGVGRNGLGQDVILSFVENQVIIAPTVFGVLCAGGVHAACPITATPFELARQINLSKPKVLICSQQTKAVAVEAISKSSAANEIVLLVMNSRTSQIYHASSGQSIINENRTLPWLKISDPNILEHTTACLLFSSGTTGLPKGVRITHANIVANVCQMAYHFGQIADQKLREGTYARTAGVLQNSVAAGVLVHTMMSVHTGMQVYLMRKYDYALLKKCIRHFSISALFLAPVIWKRIADDCQPDDLSSIRFAMSGAAPLSPDLQRKATALLPDGVGLRVNWGMTETSCGGTQFGPGELDTEGSVGRLLPAMEMVILGPNAEKLGPDQEGELCIRGPNVIRQYFENSQATKDAYTSDGWFRTGDVGTVSTSGKIFLKGRSKELIKYKGHQISPTELEALLGEYPGVADVGIIGVPDRDGEVPRAYVVRTQEPPLCSAEGINDYLGPLVSHYKKLRGGIVFVDEIPRNHNGKIIRTILKELALNEMSPTVGISTTSRPKL